MKWLENTYWVKRKKEEFEGLCEWIKLSLGSRHTTGSDQNGWAAITVL